MGSSRKYRNKCQKCYVEFIGRNNSDRYCETCRIEFDPGKCSDCGISITKYHKRCNGCRAKARAKDGVPSKSWMRYEYNGTKYRSEWELYCAKMLDFYGIEFEYEKFHEPTSTFPDFWIPAIGIYLELHPDWFGEKKNLPENTQLVKERKKIRDAVLGIVVRVNGSLGKDGEVVIFPESLTAKNGVAL